MDPKEFAERASRLKEVGKIVETLPSEIRLEGFFLLKAYVSSQETRNELVRSHENDDPNGHDGLSLFSRFDHDKPSDNARLIAAYFFQEFGSEPFSSDEARELASNVGITIPERVDMTYAQAFEDGKQLFARAGRGKFKPTVHGEAYIKSTYGVKKGTKKRDPDTK